MTPEYGYALFVRWSLVYLVAVYAAIGFRMFTGLLHIWFRVPYTYWNGRVNLIAGLVATGAALQMLGVSLYFENQPITALSGFFLLAGVGLGAYGWWLERAMKQEGGDS